MKWQIFCRETGYSLSKTWQKKKVCKSIKRRHQCLEKSGPLNNSGRMISERYCNKLYLLMILFWGNLILGKRQKKSTVSSSSADSSISMKDMELILEHLKSQCNRSSTNRNYYSIWKKFNMFVLKLDIKPKTWEQRVSLYGAYLVNQGIQSSTLKSYISAIKCILCTDDHKHKWDDSSILLHTLTRACKIVNDTVQT